MTRWIVLLAVVLCCQSQQAQAGPLRHLWRYLGIHCGPGIHAHNGYDRYVHYTMPREGFEMPSEAPDQANGMEEIEPPQVSPARNVKSVVRPVSEASSKARRASQAKQADFLELLKSDSGD